MSDTSANVSGVAGRYATALFDLANEAGQVDAVEADLAKLQAMLNESEELRRFCASPLIGRADQAGAITAVAEKAGMTALSRNFLGLMAKNRRLADVAGAADAFAALARAKRGEALVSVTAARPLTEAQVKALEAALAKSTGKTVKINVAVDESLIGGIVVKVGSKMIDASIRSKLTSLQTAMKEVG